jgi:hypothetical protein
VSDQNVDAVRITRERLHQLELAEEALQHVAAERDRLRAIEQRARAFLADDRMYGTHNVIQAILGESS